MDLTENVLAATRDFFAVTEVAQTADSPTVVEQKAADWLLSVKECLRRLAAGETVDLGPDGTYTNLRTIARLAAELLLTHCGWLRAPARQELQEFIDSIPAYVERGPYKFTFDCFSARIESWKSDLARFAGAPGLRFLEIGSFEGNSACWLLDNVLTGDDSTVTCIDLFPSRAEALFDENIGKTGAAGKVIKLKGDSKEILPTLSRGAFDFVYVDGSHTAVDTLEDAILAWKLVRPGGLLVFDDYTISENRMLAILSPGTEQTGVAVDAFLKVYKGQYELLRSDNQVVIEKVAPPEQAGDAAPGPQS